MWRLIQTSPPTIENGGRAGRGGVTTKKNKTWSPRHRPSASCWPRGANATGKCCEINSHSAFKSERSAAAEEKRTRLQSRVKLRRLKCECSSARARACEGDRHFLQQTEFNYIVRNEMQRHQLCPLTFPVFRITQTGLSLFTLDKCAPESMNNCEGRNPCLPRINIYEGIIFFGGCVHFLSGSLRWLGCLVFFFFGVRRCFLSVFVCLCVFFVA